MPEQGLYNNLIKELRLEDTKGKNIMMCMKYSSFEFIIANIERDITPMELAKGGFKPKTNRSSWTFDTYPSFFAYWSEFPTLIISVSYTEVRNFLHSARCLQAHYCKSDLHIPKSTYHEE